MVAAPRPKMTYAQYLALERDSPNVKHEYLRGEVWAMSGGTPSHARLAANCIGALMNALRGKKCTVFTSDLRVRIEATDRSTYPDVTVVCGKVEAASDDPDAATNPIVLVEVLSDSTEASDRGEKFEHYQRVASLQEYVLVDQRRRRVEVFRRAGKNWEYMSLDELGAIELKSVGVSLELADIYADPAA